MTKKLLSLLTEEQIKEYVATAFGDCNLTVLSWDTTENREAGNSMPMVVGASIDDALWLARKAVWNLGHQVAEIVSDDQEVIIFHVEASGEEWTILEDVSITLSDENSLEEFLKCEGDSMRYESGDFVIRIADGVKFSEISCYGEKGITLTDKDTGERIELKNQEVLKSDIVKELLATASEGEELFNILSNSKKYEVEVDNNNWFSLTYGFVSRQEDGEEDFQMEDDFVLGCPVKSEKDLLDQLWNTLKYAYNL